MILVRLSKTFTVSGPITLEELDSHTDLVMEALLDLESESVSDSDVSVTLAKKQVIISVVAGGSDFDEAVAKADSCIRSAIHSAGGRTPNWVTIMSESQVLIEA